MKSRLTLKGHRGVEEDGVLVGKLDIRLLNVFGTAVPADILDMLRTVKADVIGPERNVNRAEMADRLLAFQRRGPMLKEAFISSDVNSGYFEVSNPVIGLLGIM